MRTITVIGLTLVASIAPPVAAQTGQTPDNAHQFLMSVFRNEDVKYRSPGNFWTRSELRGGTFTVEIPALSIRLASSVSCVSMFRSDEDWLNAMPLDRGNDGRPADNQYLRTTRQLFNPGLDWSRATGITARGSVVTLKVGATLQEFTFGSADMATRVAYAMQVIADSCDPTSGLGF